MKQYLLACVFFCTISSAAVYAGAEPWHHVYHAEGSTKYVAISDAGVFAEPSFEAPLLARLRAGDKVTIGECTDYKYIHDSYFEGVAGLARSDFSYSASAYEEFSKYDVTAAYGVSNVASFWTYVIFTHEGNEKQGWMYGRHVASDHGFFDVDSDGKDELILWSYMYFPSYDEENPDASKRYSYVSDFRYVDDGKIYPLHLGPTPTDDPGKIMWQPEHFKSPHRVRAFIVSDKRMLRGSWLLVMGLVPVEEDSESELPNTGTIYLGMGNSLSYVAEWRRPNAKNITMAFPSEDASLQKNQFKLVIDERDIVYTIAETIYEYRNNIVKDTPLYAAPDSSSRVVTTLKKGEYVAYTMNDDEKISLQESAVLKKVVTPDGKKGWCRIDALKDVISPRRPFAPYYVASENVRMRKDGGLDSEIVTTVKKGAPLEMSYYLICRPWTHRAVVDNIIGDWVCVRTADGLEGYCFSGYIKKNN